MILGCLRLPFMCLGLSLISPMIQASCLAPKKLALVELAVLQCRAMPTSQGFSGVASLPEGTFAEAAQGGCSVDELKQRLVDDAQRIHDEDVQSCRSMGAYGATLVPATAIARSRSSVARG